MYYSHFGLNQAPFKITPNTEFFFSGGNRGPVLEALIYAVTHGEGIVKVTGEVGSGKTMLCHMLQSRLPAHIETVYIANPSVSAEEILQAIAFELQLNVPRDATRLSVMQSLHEFLLKRYAAGKRVVIFVEESQSMPLATLEEVRLLSNLETSNDKLLQIVLFGQPELDDNLRQTNIRQLRERITHSFRLEPLNVGEIREYLMFRMRAAGYRGPDLFPSPVVKYIAAASQGLTRRVNLIADKALLAAFSENTHTLRAKHIRAAVNDSEFGQQAASRIDPRYGWGAGLIVVGAALGISIFLLVRHGTQDGVSSPKGVTPDTHAAVQHPTPPDNLAPRETAPPTNPSPAEPALPAAVLATPTVASAAPPSQSDTGAKPTAVAPAVTPSSPEKAAGPGATDLVEARLTATREWLATEAPETYSIQLMGTEDATQLKHHLNVLSKSIEMNKLFVYRTMARQKPSLTVLYGSFGDARAAKEALNALPPSLKAYRPILRTVQGIQGEIRRHEKSDPGGKASS